MLFWLTLFSCAGVQLNLRGWPAYLPPPVAITDEQLADSSAELELLTIRQRLERCEARWGTCWTEVRVLRNSHAGGGHLSLRQITTALDVAGIGSPDYRELVDHHNGDHSTCFILVRTLPEESGSTADTG